MALLFSLMTLMTSDNNAGNQPAKQVSLPITQCTQVCKHWFYVKESQENELKNKWFRQVFTYLKANTNVVFSFIFLKYLFY